MLKVLVVKKELHKRNVLLKSSDIPLKLLHHIVQLYIIINLQTLQLLVVEILHKKK